MLCRFAVEWINPIEVDASCNVHSYEKCSNVIYSRCVSLGHFSWSCLSGVVIAIVVQLLPLLFSVVCYEYYGLFVFFFFYL